MTVLKVSLLVTDHYSLSRTLRYWWEHLKGAALETLLALPAFKGRPSWWEMMCLTDPRCTPLFAAAVGLRVAGEHFKEQADFEADDVRAWRINGRRP